MGRARLNGQSGGAKINGIVKEYIVQAGNAISAGDFIQYLSTMASGSDSLIRSDYETRYMTATEIDSTRVLLAYADCGNSNYGKAVIVTISGQTVAFGTTVIFSAGDTKHIGVVTLTSSSGKALLTYCGNDNYTRTVVLTVTGTTIAIGSSYPVSTSYASTYSGGSYDTRPSFTKITDSKVLMCFNMITNGSNYFTYAVLITINGNVITYGDYVQVDVAMSFRSKQIMLTSDQILLLYSAYSQGTLCCLVLTISGTAISPEFPQHL